MQHFGVIGLDRYSTGSTCPLVLRASLTRDFKSRPMRENQSLFDAAPDEWHAIALKSLRANDRRVFLGFGFFRGGFPGCLGSSGTRATSGIQIELPHFVEQGF